MSFILNLFTSLPPHVVQPALFDVIHTRTKNIVPYNEQDFHASFSSSGSRKIFPALKVFVRRITNITRTLPSALLTSLVYLDRLASKLSSRAYGHKETAYRVFVTSLIIATKFLHDGAMKNSNWAACLEPWFENCELNTMERQFLRCIDYDINVKEEHLTGIIISEPCLYNLIDPFQPSMALFALPVMENSFAFPINSEDSNLLDFFKDGPSSGLDLHAKKEPSALPTLGFGYQWNSNGYCGPCISDESMAIKQATMCGSRNPWMPIVTLNHYLPGMWPNASPLATI